ncbi:MAG: UDP-N-acetylmuramate dehydrogenase [Parcubacteria group bacterium]
MIDISSKIKENYPLKDLTTFHIGGPARYFMEVSSQDELVSALDFAKDKGVSIYIIGGGSNILFSDKGFDGLVIKPSLKGREILNEDDQAVTLKTASGESLDDIVGWTVEQGLCGMENLSFVPGLMAGLAVQNVNCYGHDASNIIQAVEVFDTQDNSIKTLLNKECEFGYRRSIFNTTEKGKYVVLSVILKLSKKCKPVIIYPDVMKWFEGRDHSTITLSEIREAIIEIRKGKDQDPVEHWSAGSFFRNLLLTDKEFEELHSNVEKNYGSESAKGLVELRNRFSKVEDFYKSQTGVNDSARKKEIKIPIAFILDRVMGLKGTKVGDAMISEKQVICILNIGNATADDVMNLFKKVRQLVHKKTGMIVEPEPELVGFGEEELKEYFAL